MNVNAGGDQQRDTKCQWKHLTGLSLCVSSVVSQLHAQVVVCVVLPPFQRQQNSLAEAGFISPRLFICVADLESWW